MWSDADDPQIADSLDSFLSVSRTALFLMDLVAVQQSLDGHRLITPDVEAALVDWVSEHNDDLESLAENMHSIVSQPVELADWRHAVEAMLDQLVARLPALEVPVDDRSALSRAS